MAKICKKCGKQVYFAEVRPRPLPSPSCLAPCSPPLSSSFSSFSFVFRYY